MSSPYRKHIERWTDCRRCPLCETRTKMVFARGHVPCDVLFIGEAPGKSEDLLGKPFAGPAGHLLNEIIEESFDYVSNINVEQEHVKMCFTNLVACIPKDEETDKKFTEPPKEAIKACAGRVNELYLIAKPKLVVAVGAIAHKWLDKTIAHRQAKSITFAHPGRLLRMNAAIRGLERQRCVVVLGNALDELTLNW
jgi:uracil-DNA glycosylase family 4